MGANDAALASPLGQSVQRKEDQRFLTGRGNYVSDIKRPGMTAGVFVRSPTMDLARCPAVGASRTPRASR